MKIGTILGVLGAAAAAVAIAIAAPSRAVEMEAPGGASPVAACAPPCGREAVQPVARRDRDLPAWVAIAAGLVGLGAMFVAAKPAFTD